MHVSSLCDIVPITCSLVLPSVLVLDLLALRCISHASLLVLMLQWGWPWSLFPRLLCQSSNFCLGFPSGMYWWEIGEWGERKRQSVPLLDVHLFSKTDFISSVTPSSWFSFSQLTLVLGNLALFFQFIDSSNFLPWLTCRVAPGHPCSFSLFIFCVTDSLY